MIKELTYAVTFPTNGKTLTGAFSFETGTTAVIGPNWSGKSFGSIEIIRYMLFGKKALRGPATDYKTLEATMLCAINGVDYLIERSSKREKLTCGGELLAINTEAVNQKVIELLGFGLEIFDFVCAAPQGQVQKFSELTPANRKGLIDKLLRLQPQEMVEKSCKEKAKQHHTSATAMASTLRLPLEPLCPGSYAPSADIEKRISTAKALKAQREALVMTPMEVPVAPPQPTVDLVALQQSVDDHRVLVAQGEALRREIEGAPDTEFTAKDLDAAEAYLNYVTEFERRGPKPTLTHDEIEDMGQAWAMLEFGETEVQCPNCRHEFAPGVVTDKPEATLAELRKESVALANWSDPLAEVTQPSQIITRADLPAARKALSEVDRIAALKKQFDALPLVGADRADELHDARNAVAGWDAYERLLERAEAHNAKCDLAKTELDKLPPMTEDLEALQHQLVEARVYETELVNYQSNLTAYNETSENVRAEQQLAEDFTQGAKAIATARLTVKAYLAPALSRVASSLLDTMTAGQLEGITVDENMEVLVGSQDINTLSGAGKTIANLALRIALGQVLTSRVFPVFIGDEIDSDMDASNAAATADALASLKEHLQQIILVTHKQVEHADHLIIHPVSG